MQFKNEKKAVMTVQKTVQKPLAFWSPCLTLSMILVPACATQYGGAIFLKPFIKLLTILLITFCVFAAQSAFSASFEDKGMDELVAEADQVFIGVAAGGTSRYTDRGIIVTDYRFDAVEVIKGLVPGTQVTLTMLGGTVGQVALTIPGGPSFQTGVRYLVFEAGNGAVVYPVVGGMQGIFQIRVEPGTGVSHVYDHDGRPLTELPQHQSTAQRQSKALSAIATPLPLDSLVKAIRSRLGR